MQISDADLGRIPVVIAYGDIRFTNPQETDATDPKIRRWLVQKIAGEKPAAVLLSGDVPYHGDVPADYSVYREETAAWQAGHIFVSAALGNHELNGKDRQQCLENWWNAFPLFRGRRWYAVALGSRMLVLNLDSNSSLLPGSAQQQWIRDQLADLAPTVQFVFLNVHHPPIADFMGASDPEHNARPNEIALTEFLRSSPARQHVRFIVSAGHIHNYERFLQDDTVYLVSGGGGAKPRLIERGPADRFKKAPAINYHYVKFVLHGKRLDAEMIRVKDPSAAVPSWEVKDRFHLKAKALAR